MKSIASILTVFSWSFDVLYLEHMHLLRLRVCVLWFGCPPCLYLTALVRGYTPDVHEGGLPQLLPHRALGERLQPP